MVEGHENIKMSNSIVDYVFRALGLEYLNRTDIVQNPPEESPSAPVQESPSAPVQESPSAPVEEITEPVVEVQETEPPSSSKTTEVSNEVKEVQFVTKYIENYIKDTNINEFVHFDNDVVLFESFEAIKNNSTFNEQGFHLNSPKHRKYGFYYSYMNSKQDFSKVSSKAKEIIKNYKHYSNKFNQNKPLNEIKIMSIINRTDKDLIKSLDILPYGDKKLIFDPASYGQYLGGTHRKPKLFLETILQHKRIMLVQS